MGWGRGEVEDVNGDGVGWGSICGRSVEHTVVRGYLLFTLLARPLQSWSYL